MVQLKQGQMSRIASLFDGWNETLIWSCLQGYMGSAWADDLERPKSAQIISGDFCFLAGEANAELIMNIPESYSHEALLFVPQSLEWESLIESEYPTSFKRFMRYAIKKEAHVFDRIKLHSIIDQLSGDYELKAIDEDIYNLAKREQWSEDFCSQFFTYNDYKKHGLGFVIFQDNELISGASSYTVYDEGIEIEIDTKKEHQRKGLALVCASRLIVECLDRGLYPSWDAANKPSVALAEKLGYHFDKEYVAYRVTVKGK